MSDKVIDLDPQKRMTKESLNRIKKTINDFHADEVQNFILLYTDKEGGANFEAFGIDWALLGIGRAYLDNLSERLLNDTPTEELDD